MKYIWLDDYCKDKSGAIKEYKAEWEVTRYMIGNKMFCMVGENNEKKAIITLKCDPLYADVLRKQHKDIIPGYYMNKQHWNSIYLEGDIEDELLKQLVDMSYKLVFDALPKKVKMEIMG